MNISVLRRFLLCACSLALLFVITLPAPVAYAADQQEQYIKARVVSIGEASSDGQVPAQLRVELLEGELKGEQVPTSAAFAPTVADSIAVGDVVVVSANELQKGGTVYQASDYYRTPVLLALFVVFLMLVIAVSRLRGVASFMGMVITFWIISGMVVPQILAGTNPIVVSTLAVILMLPVIFYLAHGVSAKTTIAVVSTFITLLLTSILAYVMVQVAHLSGLSDEQIFFVDALRSRLYVAQDLLVAGIVIGALGVLDDISISQTSIVYELKKANKDLSPRALFSHAMAVGRDHVASLVNTLVLVYAGAALPLFLIFTESGIPLDVGLSSELVATEAVRILVASIGVVSSVPITTALAAHFAGRS